MADVPPGKRQRDVTNVTVTHYICRGDLVTVPRTRGSVTG